MVVYIYEFSLQSINAMRCNSTFSANFLITPRKTHTMILVCAADLFRKFRKRKIINF